MKASTKRVRKSTPKSDPNDRPRSRARAALALLRIAEQRTARLQFQVTALECSIQSLLGSGEGPRVVEAIRAGAVRQIPKLPEEDSVDDIPF